MASLAVAVAALLAAAPSPAREPLSIGPRFGSLSVRPPRRDFRWEGTAVVGAGLAIVAGIEGRVYCGNSESGPRSCTGTTLAFGVAGAAIGGIAGHLLGRLISKGGR